MAAEVILICLCVTQIFTLLKIAQNFIINALKRRELTGWCEEQVTRWYLPRFFEGLYHAACHTAYHALLTKKIS